MTKQTKSAGTIDIVELALRQVDEIVRAIAAAAEEPKLPCLAIEATLHREISERSKELADNYETVLAMEPPIRQIVGAHVRVTRPDPTN
jgi:hypothetical protein